MKAVKAIQNGLFKEEIAPVEIEEVFIEKGKRKTSIKIIDIDEGPAQIQPFRH